MSKKTLSVLLLLTAALLVQSVSAETYRGTREFRQAMARSSAKRNSLSAVCGLNASNAGIKYKAVPSKHITVGPRLGGISLIFKKGVRTPTTSCLNIYSSNGTLVGAMGLYERNGLIFGARYYSGVGCAGSINASGVASKARKNGGSNTVYINLGGRSCLKINDATKDQGSVL